MMVGFGALGHHENSVGEQDGLVDVVSDHDDGAAGGFPNVE
ncbi:hypothetical protein CgS9114_01479 [Corynebacterium glutamicum S9114]|nr:hypothetical protein CgS9114_01479 [Corynebacterium glutamicum S9114]